MEQRLPDPPEGGERPHPSLLSLPGSSPSPTSPPRERSKRRRVVGYIVGGWLVLSVIGALTSHSSTGSGSPAGAGCINTLALTTEMDTITPMVKNFNATSEASTGSADLRSIGNTLDQMSTTVAADPSLASRVQAAASEERQAADALDAGNSSGAMGHIAAFNADWKAAENAASASTVPAC